MAARSLRTLADKGIHGVRREDGTFFNVPPRALMEESGFNIRESYDDPDVLAHIEALADAYAAGTYIPPLIVRVGDDENVYVVDGHCRRRGVLLAIERGAEIAYVQCLALKANDLERLEVMLRSGDGLKFKPLEVARGYHRFIRMGFTPAEVAKKINKSISHVDGMLLLANANTDVHKLVREGRVSATMAIEAVREHGEKAGAVIEGGIAKAEARGKTRVTAGVLKARPIPAKVAGRVFIALSRASAVLPSDARCRIEGLRDDDEVSVPVQLYRELLDAMDIARETSALSTEEDTPPASDDRASVDDPQLDFMDA